MGNIPAKELPPPGSGSNSSGRSRSNTYSGSDAQSAGAGGGRRYTSSSGHHSGSVFNGVLGGASGAGSGADRRLKRTEEKDKTRQKHLLDLVVRCNETVDGGFLAPHGTYKSNLDYSTDVVRGLIIKRRLAPFYTPLQDFDDSWTDRELLVILDQLPLHQIEEAYSNAEEEDDLDNHKIHKLSNFYRRQEQKARMKELNETMKQIQKDEEARFFEEKQKRANGRALDAASSDLLLRLYRDAQECPICFLYFPKHMNVSRCCHQPICTECFVQIKRLDPHPPHDEEQLQRSGGEQLPHTLISEPAHCPYCASASYGVTYDAPVDIGTGIGGTKPSKYESPRSGSSDEAVDSASASPPAVSVRQAHARRKSSLAVDLPGVISIDVIRPDWEAKLAATRSKLARRAATASAIHASNLLINADEELTARPAANRSSNRLDLVSSFEQRMIDEALRLSLLDEAARPTLETGK